MVGSSSSSCSGSCSACSASGTPQPGNASGVARAATGRARCAHSATASTPAAAATTARRTGQVDLVEHRDDFQVGFQRQVHIGQRLRLHTLAGVHHQQAALAGRQRARHLRGQARREARAPGDMRLGGDIGPAAEAAAAVATPRQRPARSCRHVTAVPPRQPHQGSTAALSHTSYEKSTWPGVSIRLSAYVWPSLACSGSGWGQAGRQLRLSAPREVDCRAVAGQTRCCCCATPLPTAARGGLRATGSPAAPPALQAWPAGPAADLVLHACSVELDSDAPLPLKVHAVQVLGLHGGGARRRKRGARGRAPAGPARPWVNAARPAAAEPACSGDLPA